MTEYFQYVPAFEKPREYGSVAGQFIRFAFEGTALDRMYISERRSGRRIVCHLATDLARAIDQYQDLRDITSDAYVVVRGEMDFDRDGQVTSIVAREIERLRL